MNELLVGVLTAASALAGSYFQHHFALERQKREDRRWYAEFFMGKKSEALINLYSTLNDCYEALVDFGNTPPETKSEYNKNVGAKVDSFKRAKIAASIYLNDGQMLGLKGALGSFRRASQAIWFHLPDEELTNVNKSSYPPEVKTLDWGGLDESYHSAKDCLKRILNPDLLSDFETTNR
ncbi:MAG: hypothetical protein ABII79_13890 [bacterium]